jgi:2-methylisocitrate lyase-like PEP mutase family enzyme
LKGVPLATSILEDGGKTPWTSPKDLADMGYTMILYPSTVIFQVVYAITRGLENLKNGIPLRSGSIDMHEFMNIVDLPYWAEIEKKFEDK